ncbi:30S ribosomal protein S20 [Aureispira anguillae]|uniref:Small ribosomal subunit protein bS20 n=1 Tax=Aureispira anguillae TaxID=2864201 RepID=A0A915YIP8_9BACT|nr:30S ribosomal protein S20 [Aureispira anguillae]BDS13937.1 30S ribosomal protein S20 [Aureispira anguillae]
MANHKSAKKRMRQDAKKRLHNRFYKKTTRTAISRLRGMEDQKEATAFLPKVVSMIDRLAKKNQIHKNKAANLKGKLARYVGSLAK